MFISKSRSCLHNILLISSFFLLVYSIKSMDKNVDIGWNLGWNLGTSILQNIHDIILISTHILRKLEKLWKLHLIFQIFYTILEKYLNNQ